MFRFINDDTKSLAKKGDGMSKLDRNKYDDYEMQDEYDFSDGIRGRFYKPKKIPTSLRLDNDILIMLKRG